MVEGRKWCGSTTGLVDERQNGKTINANCQKLGVSLEGAHFILVGRKNIVELYAEYAETDFFFAEMRQK